MPIQLLDLVLAACAALGQILGGLDTGISGTQPAVSRSFETTAQASDPNERLEVLMNQSENSGQLGEWHWYRRGYLTWAWHWSEETRQLSWAWHYHWEVPPMTYQRVDGGIGP
jgi:hypothetical protein